MPMNRNELGTSAAGELKDGFYVNLGIGIHTLAVDNISWGFDVTLQSENGMLGLGPYPTEREVDADAINASKETITELLGTSYVSSADSFGAIRDGHIDLSILGAMQIAENGNIANWMTRGEMVKGMRGAMDLVAVVPKIIVLMDHVSRDGTAKFRKRSTPPLTGSNVVDMLVTDLAVFACDGRRGPFRQIELTRGVGAGQVRAATDAQYEET
jgi:3-oxoacid CoA-transferase subunit B